MTIAKPVWIQISTTISHMLLNGVSWMNSTGRGRGLAVHLDVAAEARTDEPVDQVADEEQEAAGEAIAVVGAGVDADA